MDYEKLIDHMVEWMREYAHSAGAKGFVFGLSGGIDSAVVAALSMRAFPHHSLGLIMPCESIEKDGEDALKIARSLDLPVKEIDLTQIFQSLLHITFQGDSSMARSNIKPRLRMTTLYYYAQEENYLVLGPSNASEWYVGYSTKYGDSGADLFPLLGLVKKEVFALAEALKLPAFLLEKKPSAGLWEGQTDEGEMGFSYKELDGYILGETVPPLSIQKKIDAMHNASAHKRQMAPVFSFQRKDFLKDPKSR